MKDSRENGFIPKNPRAARVSATWAFPPADEPRAGRALV